MNTISNSDLLSWLKLFWPNDETLSYDVILDGYFLNEVFKEIDPSATANEQLVKCRNVVDCIKNWEILIKNIRVYYTIVLQQLFVTRLPSIVTICYDQFSHKTKTEIDKTIFLILGAAVQCEKKEYFIQDIIDRLPDESIQHGLMGHIKQITEGSETVINCVSLEELSSEQITKYWRNLTEIWENTLIEDGKVLLTQIDVLKNQIEDQKNQIQVLKNVGVDNGLISFSTPSDKTMALELAECKAKLRKLQNELDDKTDMLHDMRDELDQTQDENTRLKESQMKLTNESRRFRMMQDELDSQKESILKIPILETENTKLKEKVNKLEFFRVRCEEIREDMAALDNENSNLRDKIENNKKLVEKSTALEAENRRSNRKIEELEQLISNQVLDITRLESHLSNLQEKDHINSLSKSQLENKLKSLQENESNSSQIPSEVMDNMNTKLMRLEIENRNLKGRISESKAEESAELYKLREQISELEEEKERLLNKVSRLQDSNKKEIQQNMEIEENKQLILREKQQLEIELQSIQENKNRRIDELISENENLSETIMIIRERSEKSSDHRITELEKENSKLHLSLNESNHKLGQIEFDFQRMTQKCNKLDLSLEKSYQDHLQLSKKNADLEKETSHLKLFKSRLEELQEKFSNLEVENLRLDALVSEYHQQLQKNTSTSNDSLEERMKELANESQQKSSQLLKKISELESELLKMKGENEKFIRQIHKYESKIKSMDQELENSKIELSNHSRLESKLKLTEKNLSELEKERGELQSHMLKLEHDSKILEKENRRLKNQYEVQCSSVKVYQDKIIDMETKIHLLELSKLEKNELDNLQITLTETEKRLADLEQKNRELLQQVKEEKRQCSTLREELLNERIDSQNLKSQIQNLTEELDKSGFSEFQANEEKFKKLESKVNLTVGDMLSKKDEQISALQTKLTSSVDRNKELTLKLEKQVSLYHTLEQKYEEELSVISVKTNVSASQKNKASSLAQHLLDLKDDLIKTERQNAQLDAEKQHLTAQYHEIREKLSSVEAKSTQQLENLQKKTHDLNNTNMKLEIEKSTLKSQLESLRTENSNLSSQITINEKNLNSTVDKLSSISKSKEQLDIQYSSLQDHFNKLSLEYEQIKKEAKSLKDSNRSMNSKFNTTNEQLIQYKKDAESLKHLKDMLENEKNNLADGARQLISLREENSNLNAEKNELFQSKLKLDADIKSSNHENKLLKSELKKEQGTNSQLTEKIVQLQHKLASLDRSIAKLEAQIEHLTKENEYLKQENQKLLHQMKSMLMQNQELITESLQNRQNQHSEEIALRERLGQLQRHKERLEEKIMEQYKSMPSAKKPKGGRNKFLRKAKEMLKRRDSKSSSEQDRKSFENRFQRSQSCGTIFGDLEYPKKRVNGDRSSDYQNDHTDTSDKEVLFDSEDSEVDCGAPTPKLKSSKLTNADTYSINSSVSQQDQSRSSYTSSKLRPGSMSIYDRDEYEKTQTRDMYTYFNKLSQTKIEEERRKSDMQPPVIRQTFNMKNVSRTQPRPESSDDFHPVKKPFPSVSASSIDKPDAIVFGSIVSRKTSNQSFADTSSVSSNDTSIIVTTPKKHSRSSHPSAPTRRESLPVTDRVEEELINPEIIHDKIIESKKLSYPLAMSRPQSTIPGSASSKAILQRMQKYPPRGASSNTQGQLRGRPQTPTAEASRLNNNIITPANVPSHNTPVPLKPRPQSSLGSMMTQVNYVPHRAPPPFQRSETNPRISSSNRVDSGERCPIPPTRKESGKHKSHFDSGSNKSDKSEKVDEKQDIYYEYGNV